MTVGSRPRQSTAERFASLGCVICACLLLGGCARMRWSTAHPCCVEGKPFLQRQTIAWHLFDVTLVSQVTRSLNVVRQGRRWLGMPVRSRNLRDGRLVASIFMEPHEPGSLSPEAVRWGPSRPEDLPVPPLVITKSKLEGKTAGFFVRDARGRRHLLKLDPVDAPELLTGAEVVTSKLMCALGYRVPSYEIAVVSPEELRVAPDARKKGASGTMVQFTEEDLRVVLQGRLRDGRIRVVATKIVEGEILGPVPFKAFKDCAELRALKVAYAWVNNIDTKDHNSLLVWDGHQTVGYLIDFGTSLGADAGIGGPGGPKDPCAGGRYIVDLTVLPLELATLGLYDGGCDRRSPLVSGAVGRFATTVNPDRWKPYAPNLAFSEMTREDARWMARRLSRLSRAQLEAAVSAGRYSDPSDASYLVEALEGRRQAIVAHYLGSEALHASSGPDVRRVGRLGER